MYELKTFSHINFGSIRVIIHDGEPFFVGKDACEVLGTRTKNLPSLLDREDLRRLRVVRSIDLSNDFADLRGTSWLISEAGLYSLIMRSRKKVAKPFQRWVTREVLPNIRKNGSYSLKKDYDLPKTLPEALRLYAEELEKSSALQVALDVAQGDRDKAVKLRAAISGKREASALAQLRSQRLVNLRMAEEVKRLDGVVHEQQADISEKESAMEEMRKKLSSMDDSAMISYIRQIANLTSLNEEIEQELRASKEANAELEKYRDNSRKRLVSVKKENERLTTELLAAKSRLRESNMDLPEDVQELQEELIRYRMRLGEDGTYYTITNYPWRIPQLNAGRSSARAKALYSISNELGLERKIVKSEEGVNTYAFHIQAFAELEKRFEDNRTYLDLFDPVRSRKLTAGRRV